MGYLFKLFAVIFIGSPLESAVLAAIYIILYPEKEINPVYKFNYTL